MAHYLRTACALCTASGALHMHMVHVHGDHGVTWRRVQ
jgi:hypothetical protein